jgi:FRG domain-containing protein
MRIEEIAFKNGNATQPMSWTAFMEFVHESDNLKGYIFRGHERASWRLTSTLYREFDKRNLIPPDSKLVNKQLRWFRLCIRGRIALQEREASSANEIWAIGQHHGLATPLLDWTASPLRGCVLRH